MNANALEIGIQQARPINLVAIPVSKSNWREKVVVIRGVHVHGQNLLMRAVQAGGLFAFFFGFGECRQQQGRENSNDGNDNQ